MAVQRPRTRLEIAAMATIGVLFLIVTILLVPVAPKDLDTNFCPQQPLIDPRDTHDFAPSEHFLAAEYSSKSLQLLQGAVQIPTVVYDDMNSVDDPRFEPFEHLADYLRSAFPLASLHSRKVARHGLLFSFGSESPTSPGTLLISHQDVVAAGSGQWTYPPFDAHFDGEFLHGRGVCDGKNALVAQLEAVEALLRQGWAPTSPLVLAVGFDKEIGGTLGSGALADALYAEYGTQSFKVVVDEGEGLEQHYGSYVALAGVSEKGTLNVRLDVHTAGGHSSAPPPHTGIGIMSRIVRKLEKHAHDTLLPDDNPTLQLFRCIAEHSEFMPKEDRRNVLDPVTRRQRFKLIKSSPFAETLRTTQAVDWIQGGVKINALPELTSAVVNYHISVDSSAAAVIDRVEHFVLQEAELLDLQVLSDGTHLKSEGAGGNISIVTLNQHAPSPVSPYYGSSWETFGGTTRHVFERVARSSAGATHNVVVAPSVLSSTTENQRYWQLSRSIFRFSPVFAADTANRHTTNERLLFRSHLLAVAWYYEFIINMTA